MAAARSHDVAFVTSISAPLVSIADLCYFSSMHFIKQMGITDSLKNLVDPLWIKHYSFVEKGDVKGLKKLDLEIEKLYTNVDSIFLPLTSDKHDHLKDFRLGDFQPQYNSMTRDYISELSKIKVPWLNIYAECDEAVPVEPSIEIMKKQMRIGGNNKHKIKVIPDLNHGFRHVETKEYFPVEDVVIEWILKIVAPSHRLTAAEVERLFVKPACLKSFSEDSEWSRIEDFPVQSKGITLSAKLYLPEGKGPWPAVIIVPGGFNETELILRSPRVQAPRFAHCGFAAVVFYKRGTGLSGGCYAEATYDDFIDDVGNIAKQLARRQDIDRFRVGASGGSGGGFVGSISAARYQEISFMINKSGPIVPMEEENDFNIAYALRFRGYADSLVEQVLPLWKEHHAAWAQADTAALRKIATEIKAKRERYDPFLLPTPYDEVFEDSNLVFLWPKFRSASRDYLSEMKTMQCKYLSIYGENDPIVPVTSCVRNIVRLMKESKNDDYEILVIPEVEHSFIYPGTRKQVPVIHRVIEWLNQNVK